MTKQDSVGRSALIAIVTGALFAGFVMLAPRLVASTQSAQGEPSLAPMVAAAHMTRIVHDSPQGPATTPTTAPETTPTGESPSHTTTTEAPRPRVDTGVDDGSVRITAEIAPHRDGKGGEVIRDGEDVTWTITVSATSDELWGIYVFLEGYGHVECDTKHLEVDESTTCVAVEPVYLDDREGEVWVDAWTADRWVTATAFPQFTVSP